jgi:hypothetical protein
VNTSYKREVKIQREIKPDLEKQYRFALRSERRKAFEEKGEYKVKVFAIFYPRKELIENAHYFQ